MMAMTSVPEQSGGKPAKASQPSRRHPVRRWVLRILIGIVALLAIVFVAVQIVLWTNLPKSIFVSKVEEGLGLRLGVTSLSTNWLGHTSMSGVKLALPLSDQSFATVSDMKVKHTNLLAILLGWPVQIKAVEFDKPVVYVRQNSLGQWNF